MRVSAVIAGAALVLMVTACAPSPEPQPTQTVEESSSTPTPTPTIEPVVKPELSELVISENGLGPILIGKAYAPVSPDVDVLLWDDTSCDYEGDRAQDDYGNWKPNYPLENGYEVFYAGVETRSDPASPVARIETRATQIHTAEGLGIGSTTSEVVAVYGSRVSIAPMGYAYPYTVSGSEGQLVFWFAEGVDGVVLLQVLSGFDAPVWSNETSGCG